MRSGFAGDGLHHRPSDPTDCFASTSSPITCFIASEASLDAIQEPPPEPRARPSHISDARKPTDASMRQPSPSPPARDSSSHIANNGSSDDGQQLSAHLSRSSTPVLIGLSAPESALSCCSSHPSSLADLSVDHRSNHVHDDPHYPPTPVTGDPLDDSAIPQLIMPSLTVPHRRQFSELGRLLGSVKIMVAGQTDTGKTTLVKTLTQRCEHIVHTDPIEHVYNASVNEIYASTRPYPSFPASSELFSLMGQGRLPASGEMLDRNVCFVDGAGCRTNSSTASSPGLAYIQAGLTSLLCKPFEDSDLFAFVNAGCQPIVDAVLFLISHRGLSTADVDFIREAQAMCNVIPVLSRVDELSAEGIEELRRSISQTLDDEGLDCFSFSAANSPMQSNPVYAISTSVEADADVMDASLLMSSSYLPPLTASELGDLSSRVFSLGGMAQLRASAAAKCLRWRRDHSHTLVSRSCQRPTASGQFTSGVPRWLGHSARNQSWRRVELDNWASTLRHSLQAEHFYQLIASAAERPERESRDERRLLPANAGRRENTNRKHQRRKKRIHQDPLGLLELGGKLWRNCVIAFELVSSMGAVGYIVSRVVQGPLAGTACYATMGCLDGVGWKATRLHVQFLG